MNKHKKISDDAQISKDYQPIDLNFCQIVSMAPGKVYTGSGFIRKKNLFYD